MPGPATKSIKVHRRRLRERPGDPLRNHDIVHEDGVITRLRFIPADAEATVAALKETTPAKRFRALRKANGLTLVQVAYAFRTSFKAIIRVEQAQVRRTHFIGLMAKLVGVNEKEILGGRSRFTTVPAKGPYAARLAEWRLINGLGRKQAAEIIGYPVTYETIRRIERGGGMRHEVMKAIDIHIHGGRR